MPAISVVIPTYRDDAELAGLLSTLSELSVDEVIIVDGENRNRLPETLSGFNDLNIIWQTALRGRGSQIAAGVDVSTHPLVWVLHADCRPTLDCRNDLIRLLEPAKTSLACFPVSFQPQSLALSIFSWLSRFDSSFTTFGDQGFAFRRFDYERLTLRLSDFPLLEDVALRSALKRFGRVKKSKISLPTSARRFDRLGGFRTQFRNAGILFSYWRGTSPKTLYARYYESAQKTPTQTSAQAPKNARGFIPLS